MQRMLHGIEKWCNERQNPLIDLHQNWRNYVLDGAQHAKVCSDRMGFLLPKYVILPCLLM